MPRLNEPATEPCRYIVIALDETEYWRLDAFDPRPDRIVTTYLCSPDIGVHLCEATPSTALLPIETRPEWDNEPGDADRERVTEEVQDEAHRGEEPVSYMHRADVLRRCPGLADFLARTADGVPSDAPERRYQVGRAWVYVDSVPPGEESDTTEDDIYEYVRCNSVL